jgi:hypothetical protein
MFNALEVSDRFLRQEVFRSAFQISVLLSHLK